MNDRAACRSLFLSLCLLPTMLVVGWTAAVHTPSFQAARRSAWEQELARRSGLRFRLERLRRLRSGETQLGRVEVSGDDGQLIAVARDVVLRKDQRQWRCDAASVELHRGQLGRVWEFLDNRLLRGAAADPLQLLLTTPQATLLIPAVTVAPSSEERLADCRWMLRMTDTVRSAELHFAWQDASRASTSPSSVELVVQRDEQETGLILRAGAGLAAKLLSPDLHLLAGDACRFEGFVQAVQREGLWTAKLQGWLHQLDLSRLATAEAPISGTATVELSSAVILDGRLATAEGRLSGSHGAISATALDALAKYVEVEPAARPDRQQMLPYAQLSTQFQLSDHGLGLTGDCPTGENTILLDTQGKPLLRGRRYWASHYRLLQGLARSGADPAAVQRRAPLPSAAVVAQRSDR